ncbi:GntR family transcriptional regulator [Nocardia tengchongensis]|uniref:GntR family transcriptional regulator n=1 Tax=Nocardia tengchongensis TaxID=2055889 RepID=UPI003615C414
MVARNEILYRTLRASIAANYAPGDKLPSIAEIQTEYGIPSPNTVRQAQQRLVEEGVLETRQGLGAYVVRLPQSPNVDMVAELTRLRDEMSLLIEAARTSSRTVTFDLRDPDRPHTYYILTAALNDWATRTRAEAAFEPTNADELRALAAAADELREWIEPAQLAPRSGSPVQPAAEPLATVRVEAVEPTAISRSELDSLFPQPSDTERAATRAKLVDRARLVQQEGWAAYQYVWSTGEVVGVALVLGDEAMLTECAETRDSVLSRYAYDLFGRSGGRRDEADGFPETRKWFLRAQTDLAG